MNFEFCARLKIRGEVQLKKEVVEKMENKFLLFSKAVRTRFIFRVKNEEKTDKKERKIQRKKDRKQGERVRENERELDTETKKIA